MHQINEPLQTNSYQTFLSKELHPLLIICGNGKMHVLIRIPIFILIFRRLSDSNYVFVLGPDELDEPSYGKCKLIVKTINSDHSIIISKTITINESCHINLLIGFFFSSSRRTSTKLELWGKAPRW